MCLYCEYVVFDFEFFGFVFDFEFFFFSFVFNLNFEFSGGEKKKPRNFFFKKNKTYSCVFSRGLKLVYSRVFKNAAIGLSL